TGTSMVLRLATGSRSRILALDDLSAQSLDLFAKWCGGINRLWRGDESTGVEVGLPSVGAMEPDAKRPGKFQRRQRLGMPALVLVNGGVAGLSQGMENVGDFPRDDPFIREPSQGLIECLALVTIRALPSSNDLSCEF